MKKKLMSIFLGAVMAVTLAACGGSTGATIENTEAKEEATEAEAPAETAEATEAAGEDFHIGRRGAEAFQAKYGEENVILAIYPDNFTEEQETTIQTIVNLSDDPAMKAIIVNQAVPGTTEAFRRIKEKRPDIICIAGESHEDLPEIGSAADLVVNNDFVARGYLMIRTAHELGCDTFVHISFPRHMSYETMSRRVAIMKEACQPMSVFPVRRLTSLSMFRSGSRSTARTPLTSAPTTLTQSPC